MFSTFRSHLGTSLSLGQCFVSQALLAFGQLANWLGKDTPRPASAAAEVDGFSYSAAGTTVELKYTVLCKRPDWRVGAATQPGTDEFFEEQFGTLFKEPTVGPLFDPPSARIKAAFERGKGVEPSVRVPMKLAVVTGTILYAADVQALRDFSGRYASCATNGVGLVQIAKHTIGQHTQYTVAGRPKLDSKTLEQICTNGGDWCGDVTTDGITDPAEAFEAYAEDLLGASIGMDALVAARDTKFAALIPPLRNGTGTEGFTNARDVLVLVVTAVVLMAVRQARANVDDGEDEDWDAGGGSDAVAGGGAGAVSSD